MEVTVKSEHVAVQEASGDAPQPWGKNASFHLRTANKDGDAEDEAVNLKVLDEKGQSVLEDTVKWCAPDPQDQVAVIMTLSGGKTLNVTFSARKAASLVLSACPADENAGEFESTRDSAAISEYFKYYAHLSQQQNMMGDFVRTSTYRDAMLKNHKDFEGKAVLDVGAGSGLLSFFAAQAGARKVYAVEGSHMAECARKLVEGNNLQDTITVIQSKIEDVKLPEPVDVIISEPLGVMLVNERMLESYVAARKWLKPGGKMFPTTSTLFICPFSDFNVFLEAQQKAGFWQTKQFHGIDLRPLYEDAVAEYLSQPCVEQVNPDCLQGTPVYKKFDYLAMNPADFFEITMDFSYTYSHPVEIHGIASWFDNMFEGTDFRVPLSTSPYAPLTHWYQVRCLLNDSVFLPAGQEMKGQMKLKANKFQSYDVHITVETPSVKTEGHLNLKEPNFRFGQFSSLPAAFPVDYDTAPPPGPGAAMDTTTEQQAQEERQQRQQQQQPAAPQ